MRQKQPKQQRGLSVLELLYCLLIVASLAVAGIPAIGWLMLDARRTADINALVTSIQLARSEAAKRRRPVVVCATVDRLVCGGTSVPFDSGWMVFVDEDNDSPPAVDANEDLLFAYEPRTEGSIRSNRLRYTFRAFYRRSTNGTITFCDRRGVGAARAVIVSYTGRPRVSDQGPGGRELVCAQ